MAVAPSDVRKVRHVGLSVLNLLPDRHVQHAGLDPVDLVLLAEESLEEAMAGRVVRDAWAGIVQLRLILCENGVVAVGRQHLGNERGKSKGILPRDHLFLVESSVVRARENRRESTVLTRNVIQRLMVHTMRLFTHIVQVNGQGLVENKDPS